VALLAGVQRLEAWETLAVHKHDFRVVDLSVARGAPSPPKPRRARNKRSS
jgi:hypothetical protein